MYTANDRPRFAYDICFAIDLRLIISQGKKTSENRRFSLGKLALVRRSINTHARSLFLPCRLLLSRTGSRSAFPLLFPAMEITFAAFDFHDDGCDLTETTSPEHDFHPRLITVPSSTRCTIISTSIRIIAILDDCLRKGNRRPCNSTFRL